MSQAILFKTCLGFNDARAFGTQKSNPRTGATELIDCLNLTTTPDGCLEKLAPLVPVLTHSRAISNISAGSRFLFQDDIDTNEWTTGTTVVQRFPILDGPIVHTPIDCRVSSSSKVYKSLNGAPAMQEALIGTNPNPATSKNYSKMPPFKQAFAYNGALYLVNLADPRFIQYSEDYHFDLFNIGDNFIGHAGAIMQAGAIISGQPGMPGGLLATHSNGVSVYVGTNKSDFVKKFYPCEVIDGTLYSGFISKVYGYSHIFLCNDGVYVVAPDGTITNLTVNSTDHLETVNSSYHCCTVQDGKYLAFGNLFCLEYDFKTKTLLKRDNFGVVSATSWNNKTYYATGMTVAVQGPDIDTTNAFSASFTLPFSDMGAPGKKSIESLYFTGTINGDLVFTFTDQNGDYWELEVSAELINVSNYRIKTPRRFLGNHISVKVECTSGAFRIEELRASFGDSRRSR